MTPRAPLAGIFVGGASLRMGRAKGLLRGPSGHPLVLQLAERLRQAGATPVLIGERAEYADIALPVIADAALEDPPKAAEAGPLGGLVALLQAADGRPVLAIACDMPHVDVGLMRRLLDAPPCAALAPRRDGRWEPLCARYAPEVLPVARARMERGELALQGLLDELHAVALVLGPEEAHLLEDWDTPEARGSGARDDARDPTLAAATTVRNVRVVRADGETTRPDRIAVEEPLEIRARREGTTTPVAVTMRTPGSDVDLAAGFLLGEAIVRGRHDVLSVTPDGPSAVVVELSAEAMARLDRSARRFYVTSSCGVCGKASVDLVRAEMPRRPVASTDAEMRLTVATVLGFADELRRAQRMFEHTGALHGAALFSEGGELLRLAEDVGRHNAVDKVLGAELLAGRLPLSRHVLFLSGRIAFELVQKAALAGMTFVAGIGGPTSLAVDLAEATGITLVGFVRDGRFNVYTGGLGFGGDRS